MKDNQARESIGEIESTVNGLKMTVNVLHHNEIERLKSENIILKEMVETLELRMIAMGKQMVKLTESCKNRGPLTP